MIGDICVRFSGLVRSVIPVGRRVRHNDIDNPDGISLPF
jgi:hypothetical protein